MSARRRKTRAAARALKNPPRRRARLKATCESGKRRFATKLDALTDASAAAAGLGKPMRPYPCPHCDGWHLSSKPRAAR